MRLNRRNRFCLRTDRVTQWDSERRRKCWKWSRAGWTCSIACCRRASPEMERRSQPTGTLNLKNAEFARDKRPIEENCACPACREFTRGYIRHLIKAEEILGLRLITLHNLHFYLNLMNQARTEIENGTFDQFRKAFVAEYKTRDYSGDCLIKAPNKSSFRAESRNPVAYLSGNIAGCLDFARHDRAAIVH